MIHQNFPGKDQIFIRVSWIVGNSLQPLKDSLSLFLQLIFPANAVCRFNYLEVERRLSFFFLFTDKRRKKEGKGSGDR
ncbi:unnamed protein product [Brassica rapa subsp. narinosa]